MAVLLVLASCGVLGGAVFWAGNSLESRARSLPYHLEEAHRLGLLTSIDELRTTASDPNEDALPDLLKADAIWESLEVGQRSRLLNLGRKALRARATREEQIALDKGVQPLLPALINAARKTECSVPTVETWRTRKTTEFWTTLRESVRLLAAKGVIAGQRHDLAASEEWLGRALRVAHHLQTQPTYAATLRKCASEAEIGRAAERVCYANPAEPQKLADMLERLHDQMGPLTSAAEAIRGEPALFLLGLSDPKRNGLGNVPAGEFFVDVGKAGALEIFNRYYRKLPSDPEDLDKAEEVLIALDKEGTDTSLYGNYVRGYDSMMPLLRDTLVRRRLAEAAIHYFRKGSFGDLPLDPYTRKPLLSKEKNGVLVLYSIGRDGQDDGGKEREMGPNASLYYDIIFRFPRQLPGSNRADSGN
jgi:hypothetical protein